MVRIIPRGWVAPRRRLAAVLTTVVTSVALTIGLSVATAPAANAGGCNWYTPCGEVSNNSSWGM